MSIESDIRKIAFDTREWVLTATVVSAAESDKYGLQVTCELIDGRTVDARPLVLGSGDGTGITCPYRNGEEVILFCPNGDLNQAVVFKGPTSLPQKPDAWDNDKIRITQPKGTRVRKQSSGIAIPVATGETLTAMFFLLSKQIQFLNSFQNTLDTFTSNIALAVGSTATQVSLLKSACSSFSSIASTDCQVALSDLNTLSSEISTSISTRGGDPYVSDALRAQVDTSPNSGAPYDGSWEND